MDERIIRMAEFYGDWYADPKYSKAIEPAFGDRRFQARWETSKACHAALQAHEQAVQLLNKLENAK